MRASESKKIKERKKHILNVFGFSVCFGCFYFDLSFCVKSIKSVKSIKLIVGNPLCIFGNCFFLVLLWFLPKKEGVNRDICTIGYFYSLFCTGLRFLRRREGQNKNVCICGYFYPLFCIKI